MARVPLILLLAGVLAATGLVVATPRAAAADWCSSAFLTYGPGQAPTGQSVTFGFNFQNGGSETLQVYSFTVSYSWAGSHDFGPAVIGPDGARSYTNAQVTPTTPGTVSMSADMYAQGNLDPVAIDCLFTGMTVQIITPTPLRLSVTESPPSGPAPLFVQFRSAASGGAQPYTYRWAFGDGATGYDANPTHTYPSPGFFNGSLTVTDNWGQQTVSSFTVRVVVPITLTANASALNGTAPLAVSFHSAISGGAGPYTYLWSFGDGSSSTDPNPTHTFAAGGKYNVTLQVTDSASETVTRSMTVVVRNAAVGFLPSLGPGIVGWLPYLATIVAVAVAIVVAVLYRRRRGARNPPAPPSG